MICQHCKASNPEGTKFCTSCGKPLSDGKPAAHVTCRHCKTVNPADSKFCSSCGKPLEMGDTDVQKGNRLKHFNLIDRILKYIIIACVTAACFFIYLRSNFIVDGPDMRGECCKGHCVEMEVRVHDKYNLVSAYDIDEFNVVYPCPYARKGSLKTAPKPLNKESLREFTIESVDLYKIRATVQAVLWGGIAVFFFLVRLFIRKRKETKNI